MSQIASGSNAGFEGTLYFPTQTLDVHSNSSSASLSPYTFMVALKFMFRSGATTEVNADTSASGVPVYWTPPSLRIAHEISHYSLSVGNSSGDEAMKKQACNATSLPEE